MHESLGIWCDPADAADASYEHHPVEDIEPIPDSRTIGLFEKLLMFLAEFDETYIVECLQLCMPDGLGYRNGSTMSDVAKKHGKTKAAVSKQCRQIRIYFNFPESNHMRKEREIFQSTNMPRCKNL